MPETHQPRPLVTPFEVVLLASLLVFVVVTWVGMANIAGNVSEAKEEARRASEQTERNRVRIDQLINNGLASKGDAVTNRDVTCKILHMLGGEHELCRNLGR